MTSSARAVLHRVATAAASAGLLTVLLLPFSLAVAWPHVDSWTHTDVLTPWIAGVALGAAIVLRRRQDDRVAVALLLGGLVGLAMALLLATVIWRGFGVLIPPILGLAVGLLDGVGDRRMASFRESLLVSVGLGLPLSLSLAPRQGIGVVVPGLLVTFIVATAIATRRDPERGWRAGFQRPPWLALVPAILLWATFTQLIYTETQQGLSGSTFGLHPLPFSAIFVTLTFVLVPMAAFSLGALLSRWLRPRLALYRELVHYVEVMSVPMGGFALGYGLLVTVFGGIYGAMGRLDPEHFAAIEGEPGRWDFFFFALSSATGVGIGTVQAVSAEAQLLVALQTLLGLGWAVVVFAAVMTQLQPRLNQIGAAIRRVGDQQADPEE